MTDQVRYRKFDQRDRSWAAQLMQEAWGGDCVIAHGQCFQPSSLPGFLAIHQNKRVGLVTYFFQGKHGEVITLNSLISKRGIGTKLLDLVKVEAALAGCSRLFLITTNDNTPALRFYQKYGFVLAAIYPGAVAKSRVMKPSIPLLGIDGIPIRDEIELEFKIDFQTVTISW